MSTPTFGFECMKCHAKFSQPSRQGIPAAVFGCVGLTWIFGGLLLSWIGNGLIEMAYRYNKSNTYPNLERDSGTTIWTIVGWGAFISGVCLVLYAFMRQKPTPKCPACGSIDF